MIRLVAVVALLGGAAYLVQRYATSNPLRPEITEHEVVIRTDDLEIHLDRQGSVNQTYMVFGGTKVERTNQFSNVTLATIEIERAAVLRQSYPDFHRCSSPGARPAQRAVKTTHFIAADGSTRKKLRKVVELHERGVGKNGDRTCVTVVGEELSLDSILLAKNGADISPEGNSRLMKTRYVLARSVEIPDCLTKMGVQR